MRIRIKDRFKIISHDLGESFLILNTAYFVRIYPGLLFFKDLDSDKDFKIFIKFQGPVKNFTISQNLYNGNIEVNFHAKDGYVSYRIMMAGNEVYLCFDKTAEKKLTVEFDKITQVVAKQRIFLPIERISMLRPPEYLSFGIYKKPDLSQIKKRENLQEILPFIFLYSQFYLDVQYSCCLRKNCLLKRLADEIQKKEKLKLAESFINVFKFHFFGAFVPRMNDDEHQNICDYVDKEISPWCVFINLYSCVKSVFIEEASKKLFLLPCLPALFNHGFFVNIKISSGQIDMRWSKKLLKKAIFKPSKDIELQLILHSMIKTFRVRTDARDKGKIYNNEDIIGFEKDKSYFLDNFKK